MRLSWLHCQDCELRMIVQLLSLFFLMQSLHHGAEAWKAPNIIFILADDLGWDDVGFHGSEIKTPNIDKLAYEGIILNNYYVQPICTPTRAALMTGRYPIHTGMQHYVIGGTEPYGLPLSEKTLPQYLAELGYSTHSVGKWHLGMFKEDYLPQNRGFESFFGYYMGHSDYYDHHSEDKYIGYDLHYNDKVVWNESEIYSTELFTSKAETLIRQHDQSKPLFLYLAHQAVHAGNSKDSIQAPQHYVDRFPEIKDIKRRFFAGVVSALDDSIGVIVKALQDSGMANNTIIALSTDNGGPTHGYDNNAACNWPLRGNKNTLWEGGTRGVGLINSPLLEKSGYVNNGMMHVVDWLPTLLHAASGPQFKSSQKSKNGKHLNSTEDNNHSSHEKSSKKWTPGRGFIRKSRYSQRGDIDDLDGVDLWDQISTGDSSKPWPRRNVLLNIDPISNFSAVIVGEYKMISGYQSGGSGWYPPLTEDSVDSLNMTSIKEHYLSIKAMVDGEKLDTSSDEALPSFQVVGRQRRHAGKSFLNNQSFSPIHSFHGNKPIIVDCGEKPTNSTYDCDPRKAPCLFHLASDPCEFYNLASELPAMMVDLQLVVEAFNATMVPPRNLPDDPAGNPALHGGIWLPWK